MATPLVQRALFLFERLSCRLADAVITTNHSYRRVEIVRHDVPAARITVVRNGPDLARLRPVEPALEARRTGKLTIFYLGEMGFHDGVDYLLRSFHLLLTELGRRDAFCVLVGGGDARSTMQALSVELGIAEHTLFTGWVAHTDVAAAICALPISVLRPNRPTNTMTDAL